VQEGPAKSEPAQVALVEPLQVLQRARAFLLEHCFRRESSAVVQPPEATLAPAAELELEAALLESAQTRPRRRTN
jgi:hypothetical protein